MGADGQLRQEIERTAVGMCQRQERKRASALVEVWSARRGLDDARGEDDVARKVVHREHYALRRTSRAGGIVEQYDAVVGYVAVLYVVDAELLAVCAVEGLVGALDGAFDARFVAVVRETEVREREDGLQRRHPRRIEVGHEVVADEEHAALRVVDDVHHVRRIEILKYGHDDGTVGDGGNIGYAPADVVAADQGNLVALAYARLVEEQMQFGDLAGRLQIGERVAAEVVRQGRKVAVVAETRFVYFFIRFSFNMGVWFCVVYGLSLSWLRRQAVAMALRLATCCRPFCRYHVRRHCHRRPPQGLWRRWSRGVARHISSIRCRPSGVRCSCGETSAIILLRRMKRR